MSLTKTTEICVRKTKFGLSTYFRFVLLSSKSICGYTLRYTRKQNPTSKRSSYQNWALLPILQALSANVLNDALDNLGILTSITFKRYFT